MSESLSLGGIFATVEINTAPFDRVYTTLVARMERLAGVAEASAGGFTALDEGLASVGATSRTASTGLGQVAKASSGSAATEQKAAAAALRHAQAMSAVNDSLLANAGASARAQQAALREIAAQDRLTAVQKSGTATTRQLAGAQASLIAAQRSVAASSESTSARIEAVGKKVSRNVTLPFLAAAGVSVHEAMQFQKSMTLIQTAGGETVAKTAQISKGLESIAKQTGTSLDQLGQGVYVVAKAGGTKWTAAEQLLVMKAAAQGAKAENVDLGTSVSALTSVMMSYHVPAADAVKVQNELIVGAGRAKTTMQEYAGALSTVVPVASAAGVGFDQVAGAIATLTQHGTSAKEATQELANTIRNLQAPNNVAVSAMNQLGISSVNVSQNLGKRGLTGTLEYIESKLPKTGLVYLDTMRHMESGTKDLKAMQDKMPASLRNLSQGFLNGTVSAKDYRAAFKDLGADGYAQGSAFLSLAAKVRGYNDSVKNGTPAQKTMAAELKAIFGGAVGLNTALQLGGENMKYFKGATSDVAAAARKSGADVLGWAKTQDTLAVKMDKAKASLQVMAVEVGTALIPAVSKIVGAVSSAVHWFQGLSHTQKEILGWSIGVVAALGPVIGIASRLGTVGRGIGLLATRMATFAGASEAASLRVSTAMRGMGSALAGVGIGVALGNLSKNSDGAGKAVAALTAAAGGAAVGFAVGGPLGAAIGGIGGGVASLATSFLNAGDAGEKSAKKQQIAAQNAKAAIDAQRQAVDTLSQAILNDTDAIGANTKAQVVNDLQKSGALKLAATAGLTLSNVTGAATGDPKATAALNAQLSQVEKAALSAPGGLVSSKTSQAIAQLLPLLRQEGILVGKAGVEADLTAAASGRLSFATRSVADQTQRYGKSLDASSTAGRANIKFIRDHVSALDGELSKGKLTNRQWATQIGTLQSQLKQYGYNTTGIRNYIAGFAHIPKSVITRLLADPKIANSEIGDVLRAIGHVPKIKNTDLTATNKTKPTLTGLGLILNAATTGRTIPIGVNAKQALATVDALTRKLYGLKDKTVHVETLYTSVYATQNKASDPRLAGRAMGTIIRGPGTGTSDTAGVYALSNGEAVIPAKAVAANLGLVRALIAQGRGMASGGIVSSGYAAVAAALAKLGATRAGIAGFLGSTKIESGGRTTAHNAGEDAWGLQQWEGGRLTALKALAARMNVSFTSQAAQVAMIVHELTHGYSDTLKMLRTASNARKAAAYVDAHYERSSGDARKAREDAAVAFYRQLGKGGTLAASSAAAKGAATQAVPAVSTSAIMAGLFGKGGTFGSQLITAVHNSLTKGITASSGTAAAARAVVASHSAAVVNGAVAGSVAPDPSQAQLIASLPRTITGAVGSEQSAEIAGKNYATLAANVTALKTKLAQLSGVTRADVETARNHATALSNQAHAAMRAAEAMASGTKAQKAAKAAALEHARAVADDARAASQYATQLSRSSTDGKAALRAQLTAAQTVASKAKDAYGTLAAAAKDAAQKATAAAKQLVDSVQSDADTLTSTINDFKTSMQSSILGDNSISSLWQTLYGATDSDGNPIPATLTQLQTNLNTVLANTQSFAADLTSLVGEGASQDLITQITSLGTTAGDALAQQLLAAGPDAITALQTTMASIQTVAGSEAQQLATSFYGPGANAMLQFIAGLESQFPALTAALQAIATTVAAAAGVAAPTITAPKAAVAGLTHTPSKPGSGTVRHYALGTMFHPGGPAIVGDAGPELLIPPRGSAVIPNGPTSTLLNRIKHPILGGDTRRLETKLDAIERAIAATPAQNGYHVGRATLGGYRAAGAADRRQMLRAGRRAGR